MRKSGFKKWQKDKESDSKSKLRKPKQDASNNKQKELRKKQKEHKNKQKKQNNKLKDCNKNKQQEKQPKHKKHKRKGHNNDRLFEYFNNSEYIAISTVISSFHANLCHFPWAAFQFLEKPLMGVQLQQFSLRILL